MNRSGSWTTAQGWKLCSILNSAAIRLTAKKMQKKDCHVEKPVFLLRMCSILKNLQHWIIVISVFTVDMFNTFNILKTCK